MQQNIMIDYERKDCLTCGCVYFIPQDMANSLRKTGHSYYCPAGHGQSVLKTESDKLKEELHEKNRELTAKQIQINELKAEIYAMNHPAKRKAKRINTSAK